MSFSSIRFFIFLVALLIFLSLPIRNHRKLHILCFASCLFYAAWDYHYLGLLLFVSGIDYVCAKHIFAAPKESKKRRVFLWISILSNLGILAYFKYTNFFLDNLNKITAHWGIYFPYLNILLPAGISFYTFKTMSYTIDVYRGHLRPVQSLIDYATFVTFFPELIAGPIVRASVFLPQMGRPIGPTKERLSLGLSIFMLGLTKKLIFADRLAEVVDPIFMSPELYNTPTLWCGVFAYSFQIYCDFSGYSDMAIGTAKMIGYDLPQNFRMPYLSGNVSEFWRRWHITLSSWLRDYLYIPLGGSHGSKLMTYRNLIITMLLGGLWHGASWNFVLWGAAHGIALAVHRFYKESRYGSQNLPKSLSILCTFLFVTLCWVPFRAPNLSSTRSIFTKLFMPTMNGVNHIPIQFLVCGIVLLVGHLIGVLFERGCMNRDAVSRYIYSTMRFLNVHFVENTISGWHIRFGITSIAGAYLVTVWLLALYFFATTNSTPFIYFQF